MKNSPEISVIMSVYNGEKYLRSAIESILNQTLPNYEFIIIDDASTDRTAEILNSYKDNRIKIILNEKNLGLTNSLNKGLKLSKGKYIARMDADDFSLPTRFEIQREFLESNRNVSLCGTWIKFINKDLEFRPPTSDQGIKALLFRTNCIAHPTIMFRQTLVERGLFYYDESFINSQDYEVFSRLIDQITFANIPKVLLNYRIHPDQISNTGLTKQSELANAVKIKNLKRLISDLSEEEIVQHLKLMNRNEDIDLDTRENYKWLKRLSDVNNERKVYPVKEFKRMILQVKLELIEKTLYLTLGSNSLLFKVFKKISFFLKKSFT